MPTNPARVPVPCRTLPRDRCRFPAQSQVHSAAYVILSAAKKPNLPTDPPARWPPPARTASDRRTEPIKQHSFHMGSLKPQYQASSRVELTSPRGAQNYESKVSQRNQGFLCSLTPLLTSCSGRVQCPDALATVLDPLVTSTDSSRDTIPPHSRTRPRRLARPRTPAFHVGNTGSNPVGDATKPLKSRT